MTIRLPPEAQRKGPIYREIADAIAREVQAGRLKPGDRLPTQRDLADQLKVTVTTITRAYRDGERRGLIGGEVGRGTFVRGALDSESGSGEPGPTNLSINSLMPYAHAAELADRLAAVIPRTEGVRVFDYQPHAGAPRNRAAGAAWIARAGLSVSPDRVIVTAGGQHAILLSLMALTVPGDEVLVEEFTYAGIKAAASHLNLKLRPVALDDAGLVPAALDKASRSGGAKVLYTVPTLQNPTASVMPEARRREIAGVVRKHKIKIIEDDVYGYLVPEAPPPLSSFLEPDDALYVTSTSKSIAPGMRVGYLLAPADLIDRLSVAVLRTIVNAPPAMAELATSLIRDGLADRIVEWKRKEVAARQEIASRVLQGLEVWTHPLSPHVWVQLPEPWTADTFRAHARDRGLIVSPAREFAIRQAPGLRTIRVCLGPPRGRPALEQALKLLVRIVEYPDGVSELVV